MKLYISADMEGIAGVVSGPETEPLSPEWARTRRLMLGEVNAAIEGALEAGATEVLVNDAHWSKQNLILEELHPAATLLSGDIKMGAMMAGLDASFQAVFFIGYHARAGSSPAILDHTFYGPEVVQGVWLNGMEVGEAGINAALAGYYGVPVALISGDQTTCVQARELLGDHLETVVVKEAVSRVAARSLHPSRARRLLREAARRALAAPHPPFVLPPPITLRVRFARAAQADRAEYLPAARRVDPTTLEYRDDDYLQVFRAFYCLIMLGNVQA